MRGFLRSKLYISDGNVNIYDIVYGSYIKGKLHFNFLRDEAYALVKMSNFPLKLITEVISGNFSGSLKLSGSPLRPELELDGNIPTVYIKTRNLPVTVLYW